MQKLKLPSKNLSGKKHYWLWIAKLYENNSKIIVNVCAVSKSISSVAKEVILQSSVRPNECQASTLNSETHAKESSKERYLVLTEF